MMLVLGALIGGGFMVAAPYIAQSRGNPDLVLGYRAAGLILFCYGIYTVYIGTLNGRKLFFRQALYDFGFTTLKATLVLGMALAGFGVIGAFCGFAAAAVIIMCLAIWRVGPTLGDGPREASLYSFAAKVMFYTVVFNLIFKLDGVLIKPALIELLARDVGWISGSEALGAWMSNAGELAAVIQNEADGLMADYGMAVALSRVPWQATIAITFVVFPMVSAATFQNDRARTQLYVRQTMRYTMLLVGAAVVVLMAVPHAVFGVLPADYAGGAAPLIWLAPAYFFFSMFNVINTLLISAGRAGSVVVIGLTTLALATVLYTTVMTDAATAEALLTRAGGCTLVAFGVGTALGLGALWRQYGVPIPALSVVRVGLVGTGLIFAGRMAPPMGKLGSIGLAVAIGLAYLVAMFIVREFDAEDRARFSKIIRRGRK
jgi:O-antigen/teichoic acid export membrane protein